MILDLMEVPEQAMPNFKGGEGITWVRMFNDGLNRIMLVRIQPGCSIGLHTHETNSEIIHVLSGTARVTMDGKAEYIPAGQVHYCPKGHAHMTEAYGMQELRMLAIVPEQ